jgi:transforming growth factor-beta-induced protein
MRMQTLQRHAAALLVAAMLAGCGTMGSDKGSAADGDAVTPGDRAVQQGAPGDNRENTPGDESPSGAGTGASDQERGGASPPFNNDPGTDDEATVGPEPTNPLNAPNPDTTAEASGAGISDSSGGRRTAGEPTVGPTSSKGYTEEGSNAVGSLAGPTAYATSNGATDENNPGDATGAGQTAVSSVDERATIIAEQEATAQAANTPSSGPRPSSSVTVPESAAADPSATTDTSVNAGPSATVETYDPNRAQDLVEALQSDGRFTQLLSAFDATEMPNFIAGLDSFTLFAPTDEAFAALPGDELQRLLDNPDQLKEVLQYHVTLEAITPAQLARQTTVQSVNAYIIDISLDGNDIVLNNDARISSNSFNAAEGVIFSIDKVLLPPTQQ